MQDNKPMLNNLATQIQHHSKELTSLLNSSDEIEAWVLAKAERSATDLSDITHYLEGNNSMVGKKILYKFSMKGDSKRKAIILKDNGDSYLVRIIDNGDMHNKEANVNKDNVIQIFERHEYVDGGMMANQYPNYENIEELPYTQSLKSKLEHAKKYNPKNVSYYEEMLRVWLSAPHGKTDNYMAKGGYVKVVLDEGNGKVINQLYNEWDAIKNQVQFDKWVAKVKNTKFGTYGTIPFSEVLNNFDFDNAPINNFHLKTFKKELEFALNKWEDGGMMAKGGILDVGRYYNTRDGLIVRYIGSTNDTDLGLFRDKNQQFLKIKYDNIVNKVSIFKDGGGVGFEATEKLINTVKKYGSKKIGKESVAKDGTKFRYDFYTIEEGSVYNWLVDLFEKAAKENGNRYATHFHYKDIYSIAYDRSPYKGTVNGKIRISELIEHPTMSDGGYMAKGGFTYKDLSKEKPLIVNDSDIKSKTFKVEEVDLYRKGMKTFEGSPKITNSASAVEIFRQFWDEEALSISEHMNVMLLNRANKIIGVYQHSKGGVTGTVLEPQMIVLAAVKSLAKGVIVAHNHPSGNLIPSKADTDITKKLKDALKLVDINLLDSLIISEDGFFSLADEGYMEKGGVTFADKVDAVKSSLLKRKKVSPSVQKDYGKTYSPKEAEDSAKRIVGSQVAKYKRK